MEGAERTGAILFDGDSPDVLKWSHGAGFYGAAERLANSSRTVLETVVWVSPPSADL